MDWTTFDYAAWRRERQQILSRSHIATLPKEQQQFLLTHHAFTPLDAEMANALNQGTKPSEFIASRMDWLFGDFIPEDIREIFLRAADLTTARPYAHGWDVRSFRTSHWGAYLAPITNLIYHTINDATLPFPLTAILSGSIPKGVISHTDEESYLGTPYLARDFLGSRIALALNDRNQQVEALVRDILLAEGEQQLIRPAILGVLFSDREDLYELVGKLLIAARLQEGLRQTICEAADMGTEAAFRYMVRVIDENDLIRFSGVKRAVGCWLGLMPPDARDLDRISGKSLHLIRQCLEDPAHRAECLQTEDAMAIYIALWATGVHDAQDAGREVVRLARDGTHQQRLSAGFFLENVNLPQLAASVAFAVCLSHPDELDVQAIYYPHLRWDLDRHLYNTAAESHHCATPEQARTLHIFLLKLREKLSKPVTFEPILFPWYSAKLSKASVAPGLLITAKVLGNDDLLDRSAAYLAECDSYYRDLALTFCFSAPRTLKQRETLFRALCDRSSDTRTTAAKLIRKLDHRPEDYAWAVELLRYKYSTERTLLIELLMTQDDDGLYTSITALLHDKNEERRMAALSMMKQLTAENKRPALIEKCESLLESIEDTSDKTKQVIHGIKKEATQLFDPQKDLYHPTVGMNAALMQAFRRFLDYFPGSAMLCEFTGSGAPDVAAGTKARLNAEADLRALFQRYKDNLLSPVPERDNALLNSLREYEFFHHGGSQKPFPLGDLWQGWYREQLGSDPARLLLAYVRLIHTEHPLVARALGSGWNQPFDARLGAGLKTGPVNFILDWLWEQYAPAQDMSLLSTALTCWCASCVDAADYWFSESVMSHYRSTSHVLFALRPFHLLTRSGPSNDPALEETRLNAGWQLTVKSQQSYAAAQQKNPPPENVHVYAYEDRTTFLSTQDVMRAVYHRLLTPAQFYAWLMTYAPAHAIEPLFGIAAYSRAQGKETANYRRWNIASMRTLEQRVTGFLGHAPTDSEDDQALLRQVDDLAQPFLAALLDAEMHRSDADTPYSRFVSRVVRLDGADTFTALLSSLGKDRLVRHDGYSENSRAQNLSLLLSTCVPHPTDTPDILRDLIRTRKLSRARMIEAALFCPEWVPLIEEALELPGLTSAAYWFIAHMKDVAEDNDVRKARIARYTPLTPAELSAGAFDIAWFRRVFAEIGEETFDQLYAASKYISRAGFHARARKYADATLGRLTLPELATHVTEKRNQDSLMAYPLVPLTDDADLRARYLFIQDFLKGSKQFGAQRIASEKTAAATALTNLATNAGYADAMRLTLRMEAGLIDDLRPLLTPQTVGETEVSLVIAADGKADVCITKNGKGQKSIPAKIKKDPHILRLIEAKKQLLDQHKRTRAMLETAMEDETIFTAGELSALMASEVLAPLLRTVVFLRGETVGLFDGHALETVDGELLPVSPEDELRIAHPYHLWACKQWLPWQQRLFASQTVQPFRQVFRELYVLTPDEAKADMSLRYAGHQIQPGKASACLKARRWVADPESGLQRVDYRRNIVSVMLAMGDWFTPADIEAPTLEGVIFLDRLTFRRMPLSEVPPVLFSEIMRDMDLAVSVAHIGSVDPEASHSTIEMRAALLALTLPLFKLQNVEIRDRHAIITGKLANYTVHLGSGVAHQIGGTMLNILPVHSSHRGRIFLPFADNDPQTAEVLSKVLLLAEDGKLKDPTILEQIARL